MSVNAMKETFEDVTVLGHPMLFTCARVERDTVPEGLYMEKNPPAVHKEKEKEIIR